MQRTTCSSGVSSRLDLRPAALRRCGAPRRMQPGCPGGPSRLATRCQATVKFAKYQGLGNDFILVRTGTPGRQPLLPPGTPGGGPHTAASERPCRWTTATRRSRCSRPTRLPRCATATLESAATASSLRCPAQRRCVLPRAGALPRARARRVEPRAPGPVAHTLPRAGRRLHHAHLQQRRLRARDVRQRHSLPGPLCIWCGALPAGRPPCGPALHALGALGMRSGGRASPPALQLMPLPCPGTPILPDLDGAQPRQYRVHTLAGLIQPTLLPDGQASAKAGGARPASTALLPRPASSPASPRPHPVAQVRVDMGEPILRGSEVPTTLQPTQVRAVPWAPLRHTS